METGETRDRPHEAADAAPPSQDRAQPEQDDGWQDAPPPERHAAAQPEPASGDARATEPREDAPEVPDVRAPDVDDRRVRSDATEHDGWTDARPDTERKVAGAAADATTHAQDEVADARRPEADAQDRPERASRPEGSDVPSRTDRIAPDVSPRAEAADATASADATYIPDDVPDARAAEANVHEPVQSDAVLEAKAGDPDGPAEREAADTGSAALAERDEHQELTPDEREALWDYTSEGKRLDYREINDALYGNTPMTPEVAERVESLDSALDKLPAYEGDCYRRTPYDPGPVKEGDTISFPSYVSTSRDQDVAASFAGDYTYVLNSVTGRDVKDVSAHPDEDEVLFPRDCQWRVDGVVRHGPRTTIFATEVRR